MNVDIDSARDNLLQAKPESYQIYHHQYSLIYATLFIDDYIEGSASGMQMVNVEP